MKTALVTIGCFLFYLHPSFALDFGLPLLNSVYQLDVEGVQSALKSGADPNAVSTTGRQVSALGILSVKVMDTNGNPGLFEKVMQIANVLFAAGERIGPADRSVLWFPISEGRSELVNLLLEHGASATAAFDDGSTPIEIATRYNQKEVYDLLIEHGAQRIDATSVAQIALVQAASEIMNPSIAAIRKALASGAQINQPDPTGKTALIAMLRSGVYSVRQADAIVWLLENGADPNTTGESELSDTPGIPIDICVIMNMKLNTTKTDYQNRRSLVRLVMKALLDHGALVAVLDDHMKTPLHYAAQLDDLPAAEILIERGARVMAKDNDGRTPLDYAQSKDMIQLLKGNGAVEQ